MGELDFRIDAALAWLRTQPAGDQVARAVCVLLGAAQGPPRVAITVVDGAPPDVPGAVAWPVLRADIDVVVVLHSGSLPWQAQARMTAGPQEFRVCAGLEDAERAASGADVEAARCRALRIGLDQLAARYPERASELRSLRPEARGPRLEVAVIGPDAECTRAVVGRLGSEFAVSRSAGASAAVGVAPPGGWRDEHRPVLAEALAATGRLVLTAPAPGLAAEVVRDPSDLAQVLRRPPHAPLPAVRPEAWDRAADRLHRARTEARRRRAAWLELALLGALVGIAAVRRAGWVGAVLAAGVVLLRAVALRRQHVRPAEAQWVRRELFRSGQGARR